MRRIIVIGAGASGMLAAIIAAGYGASVTVLEGMEKPGKKLLLTGSGRCNLTNLAQEVSCYRGAPDAFIKSVLSQFSMEDTLTFFKELGLLTQEKNGYVYPVTGQAASVLEVLLLELRRRKVKVKCNEKVTAIEKAGGCWQVRTATWTYEADAVILAAGSKAAPATGSDGSGYALAQMTGHTVVMPLEALVPLKTKETWSYKLAGVRMAASMTLFCGKNTYREQGELQWTDYGITGIAVFQLSRYAVRALHERQQVWIQLDLAPFLTEKELFSYLQQRVETASCGELPVGILPKKVIAPLLKEAGIAAEKKADTETLRKIVRAVKAVTLTVTGSKPFAQAQVCSGGVDTAQVDASTLESKCAPGLYLTGELLDVDGACGGYNLQWAWSTGYVAGRAAAANDL